MKIYCFLISKLLLFVLFSPTNNGIVGGIKKCSICGIEISAHATSGMCREHHDFYRIRTLGKKCIICEELLLDRNKTGYCDKHRSRAGENNSMYGKAVYDQWVKKYGIEKANVLNEMASVKKSDAGKKKWEDEEYRKLVKETTTGKKRTDEFRKAQRINAQKQMQNTTQLAIRSASMCKSYATGALVANKGGFAFSEFKGYYNGCFYASRGEFERIKFLMDSGLNWKRYMVSDFDFRIHYIYGGKEHIYLPDFIVYIGDCIIIEEFKYRISKMTELEHVKADAARSILAPLGIEYVLNDNTKLMYYKD